MSVQFGSQVPLLKALGQYTKKFPDTMSGCFLNATVNSVAWEELSSFKENLVERTTFAFGNSCSFCCSNFRVSLPIWSESQRPALIKQSLSWFKPPSANFSDSVGFDGSHHNFFV